GEELSLSRQWRPVPHYVAFFARNASSSGKMRRCSEKCVLAPEYAPLLREMRPRPRKCAVVARNASSLVNMRHCFEKCVFVRCTCPCQIDSLKTHKIKLPESYIQQDSFLISFEYVYCYNS